MNREAISAIGEIAGVVLKKKIFSLANRKKEIR